MISSLPNLRSFALMLVLSALMPLGLWASSNPGDGKSAPVADATPLLVLNGPGAQSLLTLTGSCFQNYGFTITSTGSANPLSFTISSVPAIGFATLGLSPSSASYLGAFNKGSTVVTVTASDGLGVTATYSFGVVVSDNEPPTISQCPTSQTLTAGGPGCNAIANWAFASSDNCPFHVVTNTHNPGSVFPIGTTAVNYTATDQSGNTSVCNFNINVVTAVTAVNCTPTATVNLDASGSYNVQANLTANSNPVATTACSPATVTFTASPASFSCAEVGTQTVTITGSAGGATSSCTTTYTVVDNSAPIISCEATFDAILDNAGDYTLTEADVLISASDNCNTTFVTTFSKTAFDCQDIALSPINVTVTVTPAVGPAASCVVAVSAIDNEIAFFDPACSSLNNTVTTNGSANCGFVIPDLIADVELLLGDNCTVPGGYTVSQAPLAGAIGNNTQNVVFTVTDANSNTVSCTVVLTADDIDNPTITCPAPSTMDLGADCSLAVTSAMLTPATLADNCSANSAIVVTAESDIDGAITTSSSLTGFGPNVITLTAEDEAGNTETCAYTINLDDVTPPVLISGVCGTTQTVDTDGGVCTAFVIITQAEFDDACALASDAVAITPISGGNIVNNNGAGQDIEIDFEKGTSVLTLTFTDVAGNTATCTYQVTVEDNEAPIADCPADMTVPAATGTCSAVATFTSTGLTLDNCGSTPTEVFSPVSGSTFSNGPTTVTMTATDDDANSSTCTFVVTVEDTEDPVAICITPVPSVALDATGAGTLAANAVAGLSTDNCAVTSATSPSVPVTCANLGTNTVTLTVSDAAGNTSAAPCTFTVVDQIAPVAVCATISNVTLDVAGNGTLVADAAAGASTDNCTVSSSTSPVVNVTCANLGSANTVTLTVTDNSGNSSTTSCSFTVVDLVAPTPVCAVIPNVALTAAGTATLAADAAAGTSTDNCSVASSTSPLVSLTCANLGSNNVTLTVTDGSGNTATTACTFTVVDLIPPTPVCATISNVTLDASGNGSLAIDAAAGASTDNCTVSSATSPVVNVTCANLGSANSVTLTVTDNSGNTATTTCSFTVVDLVAPTAICTPITVNLSSPTVAATALNNGSTDNCTSPLTNFSASQTTFTCTDMPSTTVTLTVTDASGNSATCTSVVTVVDDIAPMANCKNISVNLVGNSVSITPAEVDNVSTDNCGVVNLVSVSPNSFTCANTTTTNIVTLLVNDGNGNTATCTSTVTVIDNTPPTVSCPANLTYTADPNACTALKSFTTPLTITDACGATFTSIVATNGTSLVLLAPGVPASSGGTYLAQFGTGVTTMTVLVTDVNNNTGTCTFTATVSDSQAPALSGCPTAVSANASAGACTAQVFWSAPVASDNCPGVALTSTGFPGQTFNVGTTTVTYTATQGLQSTTCSFVVTVVDNQPPVILNCPAPIVMGTAAPLCSAVATWPAIIAADNCGAVPTIASSVASGSTFVKGATTVTITATDNALVPNVATCTFTVTVNDDDAPTAVCATIANVALSAAGTASLAANAAAGASTDNCAVASATSPAVSLTCANLGANSVTLTVSDDAGNTNTTACSFTVVDMIAPVAVCATIPNVALDAAGTATLAANAAAGASTDNCAVTSATSPMTSVTCANLGANTVTLTVSDASGNTNTTACSFTVVDMIAPVAVCASIPNVALDAAGTATLAANAAAGASTDNCAVSSATSPMTSVTCANLGANTVVLTVSDASGNTNTTACTFTVVDMIAPVAVCASIPNVALSAAGTASLAADAAAGASTDNCAVTSATSPAVSLTCANLGANTVTLTVSDASGNTNTTACSFTVVDMIAPVAVCATISNIALDAAGTATLAANAAAGTSTDNCAVTSATSPSAALTCANLGANTVTLTVSDASGNTNTAVCSYTVVDMIAPAPNCPANITTTTTSTTCDNVVTFALAPTDNCSATAAALPASGSTFALGTTTVTVTATDGSGNSASCTFTVTVNDATAPTAVCQPVTVNIDANTGIGTTTAAAVNNGSSDNCSLNLVSVAPSSFTCAQLGTNIVTLTVNDNTGNTATCSAIATVVAPTFTGSAAPSAQIICNNTPANAFTPIELSTPVTGTATYTWTRNNNGDVLGMPSSGTVSGSSITGALSTNITVLPSATTTFNITPTVNGCVGTPFQATVTVRRSLQASIGSYEIVCFGSTGTWSGTAEGTPPFTLNYTLTTTAGTFPFTTTVNSNNFTVTEPAANLLLNTTITLTGVSDAAGCSSVPSSIGTTVSQIAVDPLPTVTTGTYIDACQAAAPAAITLSGASFGGSAISAAWSIVSGGGTLSSTALTATPNTVTYTPDANYTGPVVLMLTSNNPGGPCDAVSSNVTIMVAPLPTATSTTVPVTCNGGTNGSVDLTASGTGNTYLWSNGATTEDLAAVAPGTYTVTITSSSLCSASFSATVGQVTGLGANAVVTAPILCNGGTATVMVSATGGTLPYTGTGSQTLVAGTYNLTVTDANGCPGVATITITEPDLLTASGSATDATCNGAASGSVNLAVNGGTAPYTYVWSNGATTQNLSGVAAGTYTVTVKDFNNCTTTASATVGQPTAIVASATSTPTSCAAVLDGTVTLNVSGGTPGYTYVWSNGATTQNLAGVTAGTYTVTVKDANDCTVTTSVVVANSNLCPAVDTVFVTDVTTEQATLSWNNIPCATNGFRVQYRVNFGAGVFGPWTIADLAAGTTTYLAEDLTPLLRYQYRLTAKCVSANAAFYTNSFVTKDSLFFDNDGDGFGDVFAELIDSLPPTGSYSFVSGDCNDADAAINPGATEICDFIDNDCDTQIDEGVGTLYYADIDGDTYGDVANTLYDCTQPFGYVLNDDDCNDFDPSIAPGQPDLCDGIDTNCDGLIDNGSYTCPAPTGLSTSNVTSTSAKLNWNAVPCAKNYRVQYRRNAQTTIQWTFVTVNQPSSSVTVSSLVPSNLYRWFMRTNCLNNTQSTPTATTLAQQILFTTLGSALVENQPNTNTTTSTSITAPRLNVYPNPSKGFVNIDLVSVSDQPARITVKDNMGRVVLSWNAQVESGKLSQSFDLSDMPGGVYNVSVQLNNEVLNQMVVKR